MAEKSEVAYVSRVELDPVRGKIRQARIPAVEEPVLFGVHSEVAEHYGVAPGDEEPHATTLDYVVAAAGGWLLGTFAGALGARQVPLENAGLTAESVGEIELEGKVLVIKRIETTFTLTAPEEHRGAIERVLGFYADNCPVARSVKGSIEITSKLDLRAA